MESQFDIATQAVFDKACASLDLDGDHVAIVERSLDLICQLLRRQDDLPLRERAMAGLSERLSTVCGPGEQTDDGPLADTVRDAARCAIRLVLSERTPRALV